MKKKINMFLLGVGALTIISTMVFSIFVFYGLFKAEVFENLKTYAEVLNSSDIHEDILSNKYSSASDKIRITYILSDGTVDYDSYVDYWDMDNHSTRPEVSDALVNGEGTAIRTSSTMKISTFYYALRLSDGSVLRVAKEATSIWSIFAKVAPLMIGVALGLFAICMFISHLLVKSFVAPIEQLANHMDDDYCSTATYKELVPFINTINQQHEDILKNAKLRQEFTANVSHELKTPLTSISGYSELIENGMTNEDDVVRFASEIHQNSSRLLTMINDIIKLSELDAVDMQVQFEYVDLFEIAKSCVNMLKVNADNNHVTLHINGEHSIVKANKVMMEEVIFNLCDNAIRYNVANGRIDISVNKIDNNVVLTVKDNGIGISKENQERIFERFYRVDKSRSKSTGGTGLGLAIVKHIVSQHNAKMELESEIGVGTEIRVIILI